MTIRVSWFDETQTCLLLSYDRFWNWQEFQVAFQEVNHYFESVSHRVHLIIDIRKTGMPPPGGLSHFKQVSENQHVNLGRIVVVGAPFLIRTVVNLLTSVYRGRYNSPDFIFAPSLEEAAKILAPAKSSD